MSPPPIPSTSTQNYLNGAPVNLKSERPMAKSSRPVEPLRGNEKGKGRESSDQQTRENLKTVVFSDSEPEIITDNSIEMDSSDNSDVEVIESSFRESSAMERVSPAKPIISLRKAPLPTTLELTGFPSPKSQIKKVNGLEESTPRQRKRTLMMDSATTSKEPETRPSSKGKSKASSSTPIGPTPYAFLSDSPDDNFRHLSSKKRRKNSVRSREDPKKFIRTKEVIYTEEDSAPMQLPTPTDIQEVHFERKLELIQQPPEFQKAFKISSLPAPPALPICITAIQLTIDQYRPTVQLHINPIIALKEPQAPSRNLGKTRSLLQHSSHPRIAEARPAALEPVKVAVDALSETYSFLLKEKEDHQDPEEWLEVGDSFTHLPEFHPSTYGFPNYPSFELPVGPMIKTRMIYHKFCPGPTNSGENDVMIDVLKGRVIKPDRIDSNLPIVGYEAEFRKIEIAERKERRRTEASPEL